MNSTVLSNFVSATRVTELDQETPIVWAAYRALSRRRLRRRGNPLQHHLQRSHVGSGPHVSAYSARSSSVSSPSVDFRASSSLRAWGQDRFENRLLRRPFPARQFPASAGRRDQLPGSEVVAMCRTTTAIGVLTMI